MMASRADWLLALPMLIPLAACALTAVLRGRPRMQRGVTVAATVALLVAAALLVAEVLAHGVIASQMGDWPAPFGITMVADLLAAAMVAITALIYAVTAIYAQADDSVRAEADTR